MKETDFYYCKHCGNIITMIHDSGVKVVCCGEEMTKLEINPAGAAPEKHLPVISVDGNLVTVKVSTVAHPMVEKHFIEWIYIITEQGEQRKTLKPGDAPEATFALAEGDKVLAAYEYCNLHGLCRTEL